MLAFPNPTAKAVIPRAKSQFPHGQSCFSGSITHFVPFRPRTSISLLTPRRTARTVCASALTATCAAGQTQTITRETSTITVAPSQGKEKLPEIDDGGAGLPPRDDGGGGGGGGGGGRWSGGFFLFGFLALLCFLKDRENES